MRIFLLIFFLFIFCGMLNAQTVKIEYSGYPLPEKYCRKIEQFVKYEVNFYTQFGLPDTLSLHLQVFEDKKKGKEYLESINISTILTLKPSGIYLPEQQKAIILGMEKDKERSIAVIYHELCHHFTRQILGKFSPIWLNEGLSEYFANCKITKKRY